LNSVGGKESKGFPYFLGTSTTSSFLASFLASFLGAYYFLEAYFSTLTDFTYYYY